MPDEEMRICFVGHIFHRRSGSNAFFLDLLRKLGPVTELYADPDGGALADDLLVRRLIGERFDRYVFWQSELVAERLVGVDLGPSFMVPMYDAVVAKPDLYWQRFVKYHFLSFSRELHERLQTVGCRTSHFQYFPPVEPQVSRDGEAPLEAFFWERRPASTVNLPVVLEQCQALGIERLHLHAVPDINSERRDHHGGIPGVIDLRVSDWFERQTDFAIASAGPLFFFSPRALEGIGMANLEAMARGQIVVAPDLPTANEYLAHTVSGLLYDPLHPLAGLARQSRESLVAMSRAARRKIARGHETWRADQERLISIIARDGQRWPTSDSSAAFAASIRRRAHQRLHHVE